MRVMCFVTLLVCLFSSFSASAQVKEPLETPSLTTASSMLYWVAMSHYSRNEFAEAYENFAMAWNVHRDPSLAFDTALAAWKLDRPFAAHIWIKRYFADMIGKPGSDDEYERRMRAVPSNVIRLSNHIVQAINEDNAAWGYELGCTKEGVCFYSTRWSYEKTALNR